MTVNQVVSPRLVRVQGASPPWLARLSIDVPVINPAQVISMFLPGITKLQRKLLLLNLRIGREVRIRRDAYTMGGNVCSELVVVLAEFEIGNVVYLRGVTTGVWRPILTDEVKG